LNQKQQGLVLLTGISLGTILVVALAGHQVLMTGVSLLLSGVFVTLVSRRCFASEQNKENLLRRLAELHSLELAETVRLYKAQRHDYINHLQVIYGMLQTGKVDQIPGYIGKANQEISLEEQLSALPAGEFRHILLASMIAARSYNIELELNVRGNEPWQGFQSHLRERNLCFRLLLFNLMQALSCTMERDMKIVLEVITEADQDEVMIWASQVITIDTVHLFTLPGGIKELIGFDSHATIETIWTQELGGKIILQSNTDDKLQIILSASR
jgi:sensor histidine kinase regulating citrate/malate metabolism